VKLVLAIVFVVLAFVAGVFVGPLLAPGASESVGITSARAYDPYTRAAESTVDFMNALARRDYSAAWRAMGVSYRNRVSEAKFVAAWEKYCDRAGPVVELGPRLDLDVEAAKIRFSLRFKEEMKDVPVECVLERDGDRLRFETCSMPPLE
jgi:hypothetical protein